MAKQAKLRFGIIGCGNIGHAHARQITQAKPRNFMLSAMADIDPAKAEEAAAKYGVEAFTSGYDLIDSGRIDVILIATPHYFHPVLAIYAARHKVHVMTEKPMGVSVGPVRSMIAECRKNKVALGVMFNNRTRPAFKKMKQMVQAGVIGDIFRMQLTGSNWYRSQAYYDSGSWRGTWDGEGGGILLNQAPHSLDLFQWIGGMPKRVMAMVSTRHHRIEVENTANAILDYGDGRTGSIYASTAEASGMHQIVAAGEKGTLIATDTTLRYAKLAIPLKTHLLTSKEIWGSPKFTWKDIPIKDREPLHVYVNQAFADHILAGKPMVATGAEGINELELSNAIYLSGYLDRPVDLPVDAKEMERLLDMLIRTRGTGRGGNLRKQAQRQLKKLLG